jgi:hypothetical protein
MTQRYGRRGPGRATMGLVVVVVAAFLGWLAWVVWWEISPTVESELVGYDVVDDHAATARVSVTLHGDGDGVRCLVRATSSDHSPVGDLSWEPTPGRNDLRIRTERQATSVELIGCTAPGQSRPR